MVWQGYKTIFLYLIFFFTPSKKNPKNPQKTPSNMKLQIYDTYNPYKIIRQSSACGFGLIGTKIFSIVFIFI